MLYTGKLILKGILTKCLYEHFLVFNVAMSILISPSLTTQHNSYAHELLLYFVDKCKELYDDQFLVYNVHAMTQLVMLNYLAV